MGLRGDPQREIDRVRRQYAPLTESVRKLIDAALKTDVDDEVVGSVKAEVDAAAAKLRSRQRDSPLGMSVTPEGEVVAWGNVAIGPRNPIAPPLVVQHDNAGGAHIDVELGAAYEGAPGHLHGGYAALVLDHLLGDVASHGTTIAATGTITLRYQRPTRLGRLHAAAGTQRTEGRKIFLDGHIADAEGITVTAEGIFILQRR